MTLNIKTQGRANSHAKGTVAAGGEPISTRLLVDLKRVLTEVEAALLRVAASPNKSQDRLEGGVVRILHEDIDVWTAGAPTVGIATTEPPDRAR